MSTDGPASSSEELATKGLDRVKPEALQKFKDSLKAIKPSNKSDELKHVKPEALAALKQKLHPVVEAVTAVTTGPVKDPAVIFPHTTAEKKKGSEHPLHQFSSSLKDAPDNPIAPKSQIIRKEGKLGEYSAKSISQGEAQTLNDYLSDLKLMDLDEAKHQAVLQVKAKIEDQKTQLALETLEQQFQRLGLKEAPLPPAAPQVEKKSGLFSAFSWSTQTPAKTAFEVHNEEKAVKAKLLNSEMLKRQAFASSHQHEPDIQHVLDKRDSALKAEMSKIDREYTSWMGGSRKAEIEKSKATLLPMLKAHRGNAQRMIPIPFEQQELSEAWHKSDQYTQYQQRKLK